MRIQKSFQFCPVFAVAFVFLAGSAFGQVTFELLALTGSPAPETEPGVSFGMPAGRGWAFSFWAIDQRGEAVVRASLVKASKDAGQGIWAGRPGSLRLLAHTGQKPTAPELPELLNLGMPYVDSAGGIALAASLADKSRPVAATWYAKDGPLRPIAMAGKPLPGDSGGKYGDKLSVLALGAAGRVMILDESSKGSSIWVGTAEEMRLLVRTGDPAPEIGEGVLFRRINPPRMNAAGQVVFSAMLQGTGVTDKSDSGLWTGLPGKLELMVGEGSAKPGGKDRFGDLARIGGGLASDLVIDNRGQIAFVLGREIWMHGSEGLRVAVRDGDKLADGAEDAGKLAMNGSPSLALFDDGGLTFWDSRAVWLWQAGGVRPLVRAGDPAPGTDELVFEKFHEVFRTPGGRLALIASLKGRKERSLWWGRPDALQFVIREDQEFDFAAGDSRRIALGSLALGPATRTAGLSAVPANDNGQLVFRMAFEAVRGVRDASEAVLVARAPMQ